MYKIKNVVGILMCIGIGFSTILTSCKPTPAAILGNWTLGDEFSGVYRSEAISFVDNSGNAYIGTGFDGTYRLNDLWQYNAASVVWQQMAPCTATPRSSAVAFFLNGKGYIGTGYDGANMLQDFWQYTPPGPGGTGNSWVQMSNFGGSPRYDAVAFSVSGKGYLATGYDAVGYEKDFWQYDDATDTWTALNTYQGTKRTAAVAFTYNDTVAYICTGNNNGVTTSVNDLWKFNPSSNPTWTAMRPITNVSTQTYDDAYTDITRTNAVAFTIGAYAYLTTGNNGAELTDCWQYDIVNDLWTLRTPFQGPAREGALGFTVSGNGYVATGRNSTMPMDDMYLFFPNEAYVPIQ